MDIPVSIDILQAMVKVYAFVAIMRAMMQYLDVDFNVPISQVIHRLTVMPINLLRIVVPRIRGSDIGSPLVLALLVTALERFIAFSAADLEWNIIALLFLSAAKVLDYALTIMICAVLIRIIMSWVVRRVTVFSRLIYSATEPVLAPARRFVPSIGGLDFSPILVLLSIEIIDWIGVGILETIGYSFLGN